jgi:elongation factor P
MTTISEFRSGKAIRFNNDIWIIVEFQHVTPGNWRAMVRTKLKNARTGRVIDNTFRMTDDIEEVRLDDKQMQYLYEADGNLHFMDTETYDQTFVSSDLLGDQIKFLKEGDMVKILFNEGAAMTAELPNSIVFKVIQADPGVKGDSATNIQKFCTIETGAIIQVPLFIKENDEIKVDTRTGKYLERVVVGR